MAIEAVCTKLGQQDAEELRAEINRVLRSSHQPKPNLTKSQLEAIRELKRDRDCIVLTADKVVAMVIMDRQDYINKSKDLLNQPTYRAICRDPTNTIKNKLINILKRVKNQTDLNNATYKSMYPTGCIPPNFMGSLKYTNLTHHLDLLFLVVGQSPMVWLKSLPRSSNPWEANPHTRSTAPKTLLNRPNTSL